MFITKIQNLQEIKKKTKLLEKFLNNPDKITSDDIKYFLSINNNEQLYIIYIKLIRNKLNKPNYIKLENNQYYLIKIIENIKKLNSDIIEEGGVILTDILNYLNKIIKK